jgi:hypothetical protein
LWLNGDLWLNGLIHRIYMKFQWPHGHFFHFGLKMMIDWDLKGDWMVT